MKETIKLGDIDILVTRKAIRNVHLSVHPPEGRVTLAAPSNTRLEVARAYAISKLGWIREQQAKLQQQPRDLLEYVVVHAGLEGDTPMEQQSGQVLRWDRVTTPLHHASGKRIFCGHSKQMFGFPALLGDARCIECAGWLSAIDAKTDQVFQVNGYGAARSFNLQELNMR